MEELKDEKMVFTVKDVMRILGLSRNSVYSALARGDLPSRRVGRRFVIPRHSLLAWLNGRYAEDRRQPK